MPSKKRIRLEQPLTRVVTVRYDSQHAMPQDFEIEIGPDRMRWRPVGHRRWDGVLPWNHAIAYLEAGLQQDGYVAALNRMMRR